MPRTLRSDKLLFLVTILLVCASVVMVYSASAVFAQDKFETPYHFLYRQLVWAVGGVGLMLIVMRIDYQKYRDPRFIWALLGLTVVLLLTVFLFDKINGTRRWLSFYYLSVQPSELAKLAAVIFTAALLERRMHRVNEFSYALAPIGLVTLTLATLIVLEPDFGTSSILILVVTAMVFSAGLRYRYLFGLAMLLLPTAMGLVLLSPYRMARVRVFLNPWLDELNDGFQIIQSLYAVGSGGLFGKGLMNGVQKLFYLPESHTDFIFAVIGEELGLVGTTIVLVCFAMIAWRGVRTALRAPDRFGVFLGLGITMMIALQAFVNISVVTKIFPTKGIPLPFVSNGGSSLLISLVAMGILLNISQQASSAYAAREIRPGDRTRTGATDWQFAAPSAAEAGAEGRG